MANFHGTMKMISRQGGKSCVAALAYRSATRLEDQRTGEVWDYTQKGFVGHVEIMTPEGAPQWIVDLAQECQTNREAALQRLSNTFEAAEKRKDSQVYREFEFSLPNELTEEQNIAWARDFIHHTFVKKGMVAIPCFHFDIDSETGIAKPHCHLLLSTRDLMEDGFGLKNRAWNDKNLCEEAREQCSVYQNLALKEHGFEVRVDHRSYVDQGLDVDPQPKRGKSIFAMRERGIETDKQKFFDLVRLKNQFRIVKNPELVFSIVTAKHSTFTRQDIAKVLNRYIDDADQFRILHDRLMGSKELIDLASSAHHGAGQEPVYTTRKMLRIELNLIRQAENLSAQRTHPVASSVIEKVIANHNEKLAKHVGLSPDQNRAIRHLFSGEQISCVIGFAGAGKTTSLEAVKEGWEQSGYRVIGLAPTGKAARNIESCGIRSMTLHKFLYAQKGGREQISPQTIVIVDEAGMVDSWRFSELLSLIDATGAKIVLMGDGNQLQAVEAGPAFRLLTERVKPAVLETIVRHQVEWQRDATRLFGTLEPRKALTLYQENGCFQPIQETRPDFQNKEHLVDSFCLTRQMSGRIWKEMTEDYKDKFSGQSFDPETDFGIVADHPDFPLFQEWKSIRQGLVERIIQNYANGNENLKSILVDKEVDIQKFENLVSAYQANGGKNREALKQVESILRKISYENIVDTRNDAKQALVEAWTTDRKASLDQSHLMLAFTNKDAVSLNESARILMREQGEITGRDYQFVTQHIEMDDFGDEVKTYHNREFAKGDRLLFTRNDNSLKVKNGTLGTILSLNQNKIMVALDEKGGKGEEKTVSFAPNLYPFIDHGWATTIYKAQGATVDHVKLLASFEQYRNLAYVGMSRHRHSLKVFYSDLDFWRPEKVIDRLSRIQEKLSGFDYLNARKIEEQMKEDAQVLWHEKKIQQGKDLWTAIKVTTWDILGQSRPHSPESADGLLSFEGSEEMRSRDLFKTPSKGFPTEMSGKQYSSQEREALSYLQQEISTEKHTWLKEGYRQKLLEAAEGNPLEALARWQKVSGDYSFEPSISDAVLTKELQEIKEHILAYLREEVRSEKQTGLDEKHCRTLLEIAEKNPLKALQEWQAASHDYSFNPFREHLNDRECHVHDYMQQKLLDEGHRFSHQKYTELTSTLLDKPLETYHKWHLYTGDQTFDPTSGIPRIEIEAQDMMSKAKEHVSPEVFKRWQDNLTSSPETIIKESNKILQAYHKEVKLELAVKEFISLSEKHEKTSWRDPERDKIDKAIGAITKAYLKDEKFLRSVKNSNNDSAIAKLNEKIQQRENTLSRGMSHDM